LHGFGANIGSFVVVAIGCFLVWLIVQGIKAERAEKN